MSYQITITRIDSRTVTKRGEHTVVDEVPWPAAEIDDAARYSQSPEAFLKSCPTKRVYGYAPNYETTEKAETEVFRQNVEELDLAAVIKAVNGL